MIQEVVGVNVDQIARYGGLHGVRDFALLDSAVNRAKVMFNGAYLYSDYCSMAAAYAHSIIKNHPFLDGNKRTGIVASMMFLAYNGFELNVSDRVLVSTSVKIAISKLSHEELAMFFRKNVISIDQH